MEYEKEERESVELIKQQTMPYTAGVTLQTKELVVDPINQIE